MSGRTSFVEMSPTDLVKDKDRLQVLESSLLVRTFTLPDISLMKRQHNNGIVQKLLFQ